MSWSNFELYIVATYVAVPGRIGHYSIVYFDYVTASIKGGAYMHCVDASGIHASTLRYEPLPLTEGLHYSASNAGTRLKYTME